MNYTKKQHYISRYILKRFLSQNGKIDAVLLQPIQKRISCTVDNICFENDFYEDKDSTGNYINRNHTESKFAQMESELAIRVDKLICILNGSDREEKLKEMKETGEYEKLTVWLMLHLTLVLVRLPAIKKIAFKDDLPFEIKQLFYKWLIWGEKEVKKLAEDQFEGNVLKELEKLFDDEDKNQGGINILFNHLVNNHYMEIYEVPKHKKLYLSDNPIIVNDITGIDYFLPISSNYAIVFKIIPEENFSSHYTPLTMSVKMTNSVNSLIIQNASSLIITKDMTVTDEKFINDLRNKK